MRRVTKAMETSYYSSWNYILTLILIGKHSGYTVFALMQQSYDDGHKSQCSPTEDT